MGGGIIRERGMCYKEGIIEYIYIEGERRRGAYKGGGAYAS